MTQNFKSILRNALCAGACAALLLTTAQAAPLLDWQDKAYDKFDLNSGDDRNTLELEGAQNIIRDLGIQKLDYAVTILENRLSDHGDIATTLVEAPRILEALPSHQPTIEIYALASAAANDLETAKAQLANLTPLKTAKPSHIRLAAQAMVARREGKLDIAQRYINEALKTNATFAYGYNLAGIIAFEKGDPVEARRLLEKATSLTVNSVPYFTNLSTMQRVTGDIAGARTSLTSASKLAPSNCAVAVPLARLSLPLHQTAKVKALFDSCLSKDPTNTDAAYAYFAALLDLGELDDAEKILDTYGDRFATQSAMAVELALRHGNGAKALTILDANDQSKSPSSLRAIAEALTGDLSSALATAKSAQENGDASPLTTLTIAAISTATDRPIANKNALTGETLAPIGAFYQLLSHQEMQTFQETNGFLPGFDIAGLTEKDMQQIALSPAKAEIALGLLYLARGLKTPTLEALEAAQKSDPDLALIPFIKAVNAADQGQNDQAIEFYTKAAAQKPSFFAAHLEGAELSLRQGDIDAALNGYKAALMIKEVPDLVFKTGLVADQSGRTGLAKKAYERFLTLEPTNYAALNQLAWFYASQNTEMDRALALATKALELRPGNASVLDTIGWIHFLQGENNKAVQYLQQAFDVSGYESEEITLHLAKAKVKAGDKGTAKILLMRLANGENDSRYKQEAISLLGDQFTEKSE